MFFHEPPNVPVEEVPHQVRDLVAVLFKREVSCVEKVKLQVLQVSLVGFSAGCREDGIVLSPDNERRRLVLTEIGLPLRVQRWVAAVAMKKSELDLSISLPVEQWLVNVPGIRTDCLLVPNPLGVLPYGGFPGEEAAQGLIALCRLFLPVSLERCPEIVVNALVVGVAVLHHQGLDEVGVLGSQTVADRRAIILNVQCGTSSVQPHR